MTDMKTYLQQAVENGASDLFLVAGSPVTQRLQGHLSPMDEDRLLPPRTEQLICSLYELAQRPMERYQQSGDDDFSFAIPGVARFRVSTYKQRGSMAAVIRMISFHIPDWKELGIPEAVMDLAQVKSGLILFTGTAGSGKSTTQACLIDRINQTRDCHVITLEDPIEFLHRNQKSIISQREIAIDTDDYLSGLRACLRQAPDVILLGEMRDPETIRTAMTAAETGHLVIATLHTKGCANSIDRVVDAFPAEQQGQIRIQLAAVLHSVVCQQLLPDHDGNFIPAFELLHSNSAVRNLIRDGKTHQLPATIAASSQEGMMAMDQSVFALYQAGKISKETAFDFADNAEQLQRRIK